MPREFSSCNLHIKHSSGNTAISINTPCESLGTSPKDLSKHFMENRLACKVYYEEKQLCAYCNVLFVQ